MRKDLQEYYQALGLSPGASPIEIKRAYRQLIQRWHPDHFKKGSLMQTTAEDVTKEINEAYEQLFKRQLYRRFTSKIEATAARTASPESRHEKPEVSGKPAKDAGVPVPPPPVRRKAARRPIRWPARKMAAWCGVAATALVIWQVSPRYSNLPPPPAPAPLVVAAPPVEGSKSARAADEEKPVRPAPGVVRDGSDTGKTQPIETTSCTPGRPFAGKVAAVALPSIDSFVPAMTPRRAAELDRLFEAASSLLKSFDRGDSKARVLAVQGVPDDIGETILRYGSSVVYLQDGKVTGWKDGFPRLRLRALPSFDHDLLETFAVGSRRPDVIRIQGAPSSSLFGAEFFGSSVVYFDQDRVSGWLDGSESLRTPLIQPQPWTGLDKLRGL